jgi:hypothetical protein
MFPTVQPGTAMTVKEIRAGEACITIIIITTGPFFCPIIGITEKTGFTLLALLII